MLDWGVIGQIADAIHPRFRALVWVGASSSLRCRPRVLRIRVRKCVILSRPARRPSHFEGSSLDSHNGSNDTSVMEALEALRAANDAFETRLRQVSAEHWALPTPCPDWDVRALVNHVLLGTRMSVQVLAGMPREDVIAGLDDDLLAGDIDPVAAFVDLAEQMVQGFSGPAGLDGVVAHPGGDFPRSVFVGFRVADGAVHAWDLAFAIGADTTLGAELVEFLWDDVQPRRDMMLASGLFGDGPSGAVSDDAPLQRRYLDLIGRRP